MTALAGVAYDVDREYVAEQLGFSRISRNSLDAVSDRDWICDLLYAGAVIGVHLEGVDIVTLGLAGELSRWSLPQSEAVIEACAHHPPCANVR